MSKVVQSTEHYSIARAALEHAIARDLSKPDAVRELADAIENMIEAIINWRLSL